MEVLSGEATCVQTGAHTCPFMSHREIDGEKSGGVKCHGAKRELSYSLEDRLQYVCATHPHPTLLVHSLAFSCTGPMA